MNVERGNKSEEIGVKLDSLNVGLQAIEGLIIVPSTQTITTDQQIYNNIRIKGSGQLTIQSELEFMGKLFNSIILMLNE